jgi:hypothetical protein
MSFRDCINDAEGKKELTADQAKDARELFDGLEAQYQGRMNRAAAQAQAGADAFDTIRKQAMQRKRQKAMQLRTWQGIKRDIASYRGIDGKPNEVEGAYALFEEDQLSTYSSITQREGSVKGEAFGEMNRVLGEFRRNIVGEVRQKATLNNMVREVFGENTGDASAREFAKAWQAASELLRKRFNRAGGAIAKRTDWGMPQNHDQIAITKAGYTAWRDFIGDRLDRDKMIDEQTGLRFSDEKLELVLTDVYKTISTDGLNKLIPGAQGYGKSLGNRRQDHRFLSFETATGWLEYQKKFGDANSFDTMISHITNMSRDISLMEILGPNPAATLQFLKQTLVKNAKTEKAVKQAKAADTKIDNLYMFVTGKNNSPVNGFWASTFAGTRQLLTAAQLGSASLGAITDLNFQRMARSFAGLPQTSTLNGYLKQLAPLGQREKGELAIRLGLIAEGWTSLAAAQMRYVGDVSGPEVTRRISDFVMRASLLSPMTSAGRWAFGMEFLGFMAQSRNLKFNELEPNFKRTFERYGLGESSWNQIRSTDLYNFEGATFLRPADIRARTDLTTSQAEFLTTRVLEMVNSETNFAVPSTNMRGKMMLQGDTRPGTVSGELARSFGMYKGFGVTLVNTHLIRGMSQEGVRGKGTYFADLLLSATVMGALALQLKEMSKGRDPRPMFGDSDETMSFWGAAFLQGGGLGIYGDFLFADRNRYGGGLKETVAGPVVGVVDDALNLTVGNAIQLARGEDTKIGSELARFAQDYTPGSSIWYARLGLERVWWDRLQIMTDPKAKQKMRKRERKYKKDYGQKYWWAPGDAQPTRSPNLDNALGN